MLRQMGIEADSFGPQLVVFLWDEGGPVPIGGYLVVDNTSRGLPAMGVSSFLPSDGVPSSESLMGSFGLAQGAHEWILRLGHDESSNSREA